MADNNNQENSNQSTVPGKDSSLPPVDDNLKNQFAKTNQRHSTFQLSDSDKVKIPSKWLHWAIFIIPLGLIFTIVILVYAFYFIDNPLNFGFFREDSVTQKFAQAQIDNPPVESDLEKFKRQYEEERQVITTLATETSSINISACKPKPLVAQIAKGQTLTITNQDASNITIVIDKDYPIPANGSVEITADFETPNDKDTGISYTCGNPDDIIGYIVVTDSPEAEEGN